MKNQLNIESLEKIGFTTWFLDHLSSEPIDFEIARVTTVHKESYIVTNGAWETRAEITGKLMFSSESSLDFPTVGDFCYVQFFGKNSTSIIHEVLSRRSILKRKTPGKKIDFQLIASNIDAAFIVQSLDSDFSIRRIERYLVMIHEGNIKPIILLSKSDLLSQKELEEKVSEVQKSFPDTTVIAFSGEQTTGLSAVTELLKPGQTFCLLGSSGVGKTTLLNNLPWGRKIRNSSGAGKR